MACDVNDDGRRRVGSYDPRPPAGRSVSAAGRNPHVWLTVPAPRSGDEGENAGGAAGAAGEAEDADGDRRSGGRELIEVGEVLEDDAVAGEHGGVGAELLVLAGIDAVRVDAHAGDVALVEQPPGGVAVEAGEVQPAGGVLAEERGRAAPTVLPPGEQHHHRAVRHPTVGALPRLHVVTGERVVRVVRSVL